MKDPKKITDTANIIVTNSQLQPRDGQTFCNVATQIMAEALGYSGFKGLIANQIIDIMMHSDDWSEVPLEKAQDLVNKGTWIVAGQKEDAHGHVCTVIPGTTVRAGHWSIQVPVCVNVGKDIFTDKGINWAFQDVPKLWAWRPTL